MTILYYDYLSLDLSTCSPIQANLSNFRLRTRLREYTIEGIFANIYFPIRSIASSSGRYQKQFIHTFQMTSGRYTHIYIVLNERLFDDYNAFFPVQHFNQLTNRSSSFHLLSLL